MGSNPNAPFDWNSPEFKTGEYVKFANKGDEIAGTIEEISTFTFEPKEMPDGTMSKGSTVPTLKLRVAKDQYATVTVSNAHLLEKVTALKPQVGDEIHITYVDDTATKYGGKKKMFLVKVTKGVAPSGVEPQVTPDSEDTPIPF